MAIEIDWDEAALDDLLNSIEGPVGQLIAELSLRASVVATSVVHVRPGTPASATTGRTSNARPPGFTKARIRPHLARGSVTGGLYGGVNSPADPTIFLEQPASQIANLGHRFPFLTTGLYSLEGTF
jgi:hypothetical protein